MISKINGKPDSVTVNGMSRWISYNNYGGINERTITNKFDKNHHMYQKYGISALELRKFNDGREYIYLEGDIFDGAKKKNFSYSASNANSSVKENVPPYKNVKAFLKDLCKVRKMNISDSMINVIKNIH